MIMNQDQMLSEDMDGGLRDLTKHFVDTVAALLF